jgi:hypothetical protein
VTLGRIPKSKGCRVCKARFYPARPLQMVCSPSCAAAMAERARIRAENRALSVQRREEKEARRKRREDKQRIKTSGHWLSLTQGVVNAFIRLRDEGKPCPTCGRHKPIMQAGHVIGRGAQPALRFDTRNIFAQCSGCNTASGKYRSTDDVVSRKYKAWVAETYGPQRLAWLVGHHPPRQYRPEQLARIRALFARRARNYRKWRCRE